MLPQAASVDTNTYSELETCSILSINLNELTKPYQLSQLILELPQYKQRFLSQQTKDDNDHDNDLIVCQKLASFMYKEQMNGKYLMNTNFNKNDFENMMILIHDKQYNSDWIWNLILTLQTNSKSKSNTIDKLKWIHGSWSKRQIIVNAKTKHKNGININNVSSLTIDNLLDEIADDEQKQSNHNKNARLLKLDHWIRNLWKIGSKVEIYSFSSDSWFKGNIVKIVNDDQGEWMEVEYIVHKKLRSKQTPRNDVDAIRPFLKVMPIYQYIFDAIHPFKNGLTL